MLVEGRLAALTLMHVAEEIKVVVKEIFQKLVELSMRLLRLLTELRYIGQALHLG